MQNIHIIENYYQLIMRRCKNQRKRISFSLTLEIFCCFCGIAFFYAYLLFGDWDLPIMLWGLPIIHCKTFRAGHFGFSL